MMEPSQALRISDDSGVGAARREAATLARRIGLDEQAAGRLAIVVTELGNNVCRHGRGGEIVLRALRDGGIEVLALDKGPGISDVGRALGDGYSTKGTAGTGLGAARRLSQAFDIYSTVDRGPGSGTAIVARVMNDAHREAARTVAGVCVAKPGEEIPGDAWTRVVDGERTVVMVADGLGHGPDAAAAARAATALLAAEARRAPSEILTAAHEALRSTRGAVVAVAAIDRAAHEVVFSGLGNVFGQLVRADGHTDGIASSYGTIGASGGADVRRLHDQRFPFSRDDLLILATDGVRPKWQWASYPGLARRDPALVAGVLYRDFAAGRDDATVVVARES